MSKLSDPHVPMAKSHAGNSEVEDKDLEAAAHYNNDRFISEWIKRFTQEEKDKDKEIYRKRCGSLLRKASYCHSVDVVKCIVPPGSCDDLVNHADPDGKTPLHHAAEGYRQIDMDPVKTTNELLDIMGYLFKYGADPTVKSDLKTMSKTARDIATEHGFKLGAALLEVFECIWTKSYVYGHDQIATHKQLLKWAVEREYANITRCILRMNITALADQDQHVVIQQPISMPPQDRTAMQFLMGTAEGLGVETLIHVAANVGNPELLKVLLIFSGLSLNTLVNRRWSSISKPIDIETDGMAANKGSQTTQTPLSLILAQPSHYNVIKNAFASLQSSSDLVKHIDISFTMTDCLPKELFYLNAVYTLNTSNNNIANLPFVELSSQLRPAMLSDLNVSSNNLQAIPLEVFGLPNLSNLDVSHNPLMCLPELWWMSESLVNFNASSTGITEICSFSQTTSSFPSSNISPRRMRGLSTSSQTVEGSPLKELNVGACKLHGFPTYLACFFPNLQLLNMSRNKITSCCSINELPALLEELDLSQNQLQSGVAVIFTQSVSDSLRCHQNHDIDCSLRCTHMRHTQLLKLKTLNLSDNNFLEKIVMHCENVSSSTSLTTGLFFPKLRKLMLKNCGLKQAPVFLGRMAKLYHLDISYNEMKVPREVHKLEELSTFIYNGLPDSVTVDLDNFHAVQDKQIFLMQENSQHAASVKMMFVGLSGRGKTTLLYHLKYRNSKPITFRERLSTDNYTDQVKSTIGIDQDLWCYSKHMDDERRFCDGITFFAWDFAGEEEYSAAHQCFITENSLYVLCWRVTDGEDGIQELKDWLVTIKARAKSAVVVVVGTHIDRVKNFEKDKKLLYVRWIEELYSNHYCYPPIKAIKFVSCDVKYRKYEMLLKDLRDTLYDVASAMKLSLISGNKRYEQELIYMRIPVKYSELKDRIIVEATYYRRHREKGPPILSWDEIVKLGSQCDLKDENDLAVAVKYVQGQGTLMHFDSVALKDLYFIDSQWLCDVFAHVVSPKCNGNFAVNGKADRKVLEESLTDTFKIPREFMEPIVALLCKFELAIPLDRDTFLIPSLILEVDEQFSRKRYYFPRRTHEGRPHSTTVASDSPSAIELPANTRPRSTTGYLSVVAQQRTERSIQLQSTGMCFRRIFSADHIPSNFWPRVIARFLASAESFYKIISDNCCPEVHPESYIGVGGATIGGLMCSWSYGKNSIELKLGDDLILCVNALFNIKNVYDKKDKRKVPISHSVEKVRKMQIYCNMDSFTQANVSDGFEVNVPDYVVITPATGGGVEESNLMSVQMLSHILETVDEVFKDWFEGLLERGIYSDKNLCHFIPCPYCYGDKSPSASGSDLMKNSSSSRHSDSVDPFGFSIQHCLFQGRRSDFVQCPHHGKLELQSLTPDLMFEDKKFNKIDIKLLKMEPQPLGEGGFGAVYKAKYCTSPAQIVAVKSFTKQEDDLTAEDLAQIYADVRLEFNKLVSIHHPNIVKCFGFCVTTLSFVLELAPLGSLKSIMKTYGSSGYHMCPSSVVDTIKQVSQALHYLHTKEMIVHYDIKPDNILVFSFPQAGHDCFDVTNKMVCSACQTEDSKVTVKLADLGISAFVGPAGFRRRPGTKGHTAPEAIRYAGKESLGEKVDIFSLGITMYEMMTLQDVPPKDVSVFEFDSDIKDGIRPPFFEEGPKYPIILKELVVNCWAQEYAARPTAQEIVSILQSPDYLKLTNTYNTELPYSVVSAALVVTVEDQQSLWLAHTTDKYKVTIYEFTDPEYSIDLCKPAKVIVMKKAVKMMCQVNGVVWMASENGMLTVVCGRTYSIEHRTTKPEFAQEDLVAMVAVDHQAGLFALGYASGLLYFVSFHLTFSLEGSSVLQSFGYAVIDEIATEQEQIKFSNVTVSSVQLCGIEICRQEDVGLFEVWCGCSEGVIAVYTPPNDDNEARLKTEIKTYECSPDISQDSNIMQLKSHCLSVSETHMLSLHDCGRIISCWSVGDQPTLMTVIKPSCTISPMTSILPIGGILNIVNKMGKVYQLSLGDAIARNDYSCIALPNPYQSSVIESLFGLRGQMSTKGFVSNVGGYPEEVYQVNTEEDDSFVSLTMRPPSDLPCIVLLASGYTNQIDNPLVYLTTWTYFQV